MRHTVRIHPGRLSRTVAVGAILVTVAAGGTAAEADTGELPLAAFTHTSIVEDDLTLADIYAGRAEADPEVDIDTTGPIAVETIYTLQLPDVRFEAGWHSNDGPVIVTVTTGTLTLMNGACQLLELAAGHSYIAPSRELLNAVVLPDRNSGGEAVGWFTTRLSPAGAADPVVVEPPCAK